jgi:multicomponent Na+:H+ antiporter subunit E
MTQVAVIHVFIALVWMFLSGNTTLGGLGTGLAASFMLLALFRKVLNCQDYVRRVTAMGVFVWRFLWQIVTANLRIATMALQKDAGQVQGRFMKYNVADLSEFEVYLLCWCISLTPGTAVADQHDGELVLHAFASGEPDEIRHHLDRDVKNNILAFTR